MWKEHEYKVQYACDGKLTAMHMHEVYEQVYEHDITSAIVYSHEFLV